MQTMPYVHRARAAPPSTAQALLMLEGPQHLPAQRPHGAVMTTQHWLVVTYLARVAAGEEKSPPSPGRGLGGDTGG